MLLPPSEKLPITVDVLSDADDWQLKKLMNGFLSEIGAAPLSEENQERLSAAIRGEKLTFFVARRACRMVGMCSVSRFFSGVSCADRAVFDSFYIEPAFRKQGAARKLVSFARQWYKEQNLSLIALSRAAGDQARCRSLGFARQSGTTLAYFV